jgi:hypothetical protein
MGSVKREKRRNLPVRILLTPTELADIVAGSSRDESGMIRLDIPDRCVAEDDELRLILANPQIVRYGDKHVRLTATPYALIRYVLSAGGSAEIDDVKRAVWLGAKRSDGRVRGLVHQINAAFTAAGLPCPASSTGSRITIQERF